jgi:hypothetical protein
MCVVTKTEQKHARLDDESGDHRTIFYAQASMVVHYLYDNRMIPKLAYITRKIDQGMPVEQAVQRSFGMSSAPSDSSEILADIYRHSLDYRQRAVAEFEEILKSNPNHAATLRDLGSG